MTPDAIPETVIKEIEILSHLEKIGILNQSTSLGDTQLVFQILKLMDRKDLKPTDLFQSLLTSCQKGFLDIVMILINDGAQINTKNRDGNTPLMFAAEAGHFRIVSVLLDLDAHVNAINNKNETALIKAIRRGHVEIAKELLLYGCRPFPLRIDGLTPMNFAKDMHQFDVSNALVKQQRHLEDIFLRAVRGYLPKSCSITASRDDGSSIIPVQLVNFNEEPTSVFTFKFASDDLSLTGKLPKLSPFLLNVLFIIAVKINDDSGEVFHDEKINLNCISNVLLDNSRSNCREFPFFGGAVDICPVKAFNLPINLEYDHNYTLTIKTQPLADRKDDWILFGFYSIEITEDARILAKDLQNSTS